MVVTNKDLIQLDDNNPYRHYSHVFNTLSYFLAFLVELLPAGFPLHSELSVPTQGTVVCI